MCGSFWIHNADSVLLKRLVTHYMGIVLLDLHSFSASRGLVDFESFLEPLHMYLACRM
jgi:hypothetical protein